MTIGTLYWIFRTKSPGKMKHISLDNRFFKKIAHRNQKYIIGDVAFEIVLFHSLNHSRYVTAGLHYQTTLELSLIEEGRIEYFTDEALIPLEAGDVFFMPPETLHNWRVLQRPFLITGFQLAISTESGRNAFLQYCRQQSGKQKYHLKDFFIFREIIQKIRNEIRLKQPYFMYNIDCLIQQLLIEFMRRVPLISEKKTETNNQSFSNSARIRIVKDFVKINMSAPITLTDVANHVNMSIRHLNRIFTEQEGISLGAYILDCKINLAKHELEKTKKSVKEIALHLGFSDINYFCRIFKKKTGYSPSTYRNIQT